jgi:hypothetical protein
LVCLPSRVQTTVVICLLPKESWTFSKVPQ